MKGCSENSNERPQGPDEAAQEPAGTGSLGWQGQVGGTPIGDRVSLSLTMTLQGNNHVLLHQETP